MVEYALIFSAVFVGIVYAITYYKLHPFLVLLVAGFACGMLLGISPQELMDMIMNGFSDTVQWIGVIMILGTVIGEILNRTGGARKLAHSIVRITGIKRLPIAMGSTGYFIAIPVFVDVAYIVLQPITEALSTKRGRILPVGLSLAAGLTATHALLPPTPGPLVIASIIGADLGRLILINGIVALFAITGGIVWATYFCDRSIEYDKELAERFADEPEVTESKPDGDSKFGQFKYLLPILIPLILISLSSFFTGSDDPAGIWIIGDPVVALVVGVAIAYGVAVSSRKSFSENLWTDAIVKSAEIIMITAAGGAFGNVIKQSGFDELLMTYSGQLQTFGFLFPFLLAAILTTATGSLTVSMITSASVVAPMVDILPLSAEMIAALIGCGAFCVFHVNSSFFWLLNRLHKIPVNTLLRTYTLQSLVMGVSGLVGVGVLYLLGVR